MDPYRMRRSSFTPPFSNATQEPLIVVEESGMGEEEEAATSSRSSQRNSLDIDSPVNPYLLSPWRDPRETRKHSLPTTQVTQGITASQVRRLSERGGEGSGPTPREAAFLATLCQPTPAPGGRRHSVVTISKVPNTIFGRNRRESIAALPTTSNNRPGNQSSSSRRESLTGPPSTDIRGSIHNLQLDIMDDIVQARKARMKLWNTSNEKVCEVHTLDENDANKSSPMRYTNRRYSDFVSAPLPTIQSHRRASEMPSLVSPSTITNNTTTTTNIPGSSTMASFGRKLKAGIVCTNTDLLGLLSTLTSSATEINEYEEIPEPTTKLITAESMAAAAATAAGSSPSAPSKSPVPKPSISPSPSIRSARSPSVGVIPKVVATKASPEHHLQQQQQQQPRRKSTSKASRSNSFDASVLNNAKQFFTAADEKTAILSGWFTKRHQPMATKKGGGGVSGSKSGQSAAMAFSKDMLDRFKDKDKDRKETSKRPAGGGSGGSNSSSSGGTSSSGSGKLKWDHKSPVVDAHVIGSAIEGFLRRSSTTSSKGATPKETSRLKKPEKGGGNSSSMAANGANSSSSSSSRSIWFGKGDEDDSKDTCDSSLCSTLKDLFVK